MRHPPLFRFVTYPSEAFDVLAGVNTGDPVGRADDMVPGDIYRLRRAARPARLAIADEEAGQVVADTSEAGRPGEPLRIVDCHRFMDTAGQLIELLVLDRDTAQGPARHILPLAALSPDQEYELIDSETRAAPDRLADIASVRFVAGTHVTMSDGRQVAVEDVKVGDVLLTRSHGPQPVRWIGHQTYRATGASALVRITAGTLNTARDLWLSPQHRLFIWQRTDRVNAGRAEVMVRAEHLVNGDTVRREDGGHVDSFQLIFDGHEIIYAEGIAVESLLVTGLTRARLPDSLTLDRQSSDGGTELELDEGALGPDAADKLTRASRGDGS
jgi:hypothetical protein